MAYERQKLDTLGEHSKCQKLNSNMSVTDKSCTLLCLQKTEAVKYVLVAW